MVSEKQSRSTYEAKGRRVVVQVKTTPTNDRQRLIDQIDILGGLYGDNTKAIEASVDRNFKRIMKGGDPT